MSNLCEDYPCCGHSNGECPSQNDESIKVCIDCGKTLPQDSTSSICYSCFCEMGELDFLNNPDRFFN
jgi:hypothetical protein